MSLLIPPAVNYPSPQIQLPTKLRYKPIEGDQYVPLKIDWNVMGGSNRSLYVNLGQDTTMNFTQVCSLFVDNSRCGANIQFMFPDTEFVLTVGAYQTVLCPVITNQTQFYIVAQGEFTASDADITNIMVMNFVAPTINLPVTSSESDAVVTSASAAAFATTQIISASVLSGTIEALSIGLSAAAGATVPAGGTATLKDGLGNILWSAVITQGVATSEYQNALAQLAPLAIRFTQGVQFQFSGTTAFASGSFYINVYYRTP